MKPDARALLLQVLLASTRPGELEPTEAQLASALALELGTRLDRREPPEPESTRRGSSEEPERLLSPAEAARRLGVSVRWLYRNARRLPFTRKLTKRTLRFHEQGLAKYIREKRP